MMHLIESSSEYQVGNYNLSAATSMEMGVLVERRDSGRSTAEEAACKNHSEAERRRRNRINGHLTTLRDLLPNTIKTDKASLLAEVVRQVRELKKEAAELDASMPAMDNCDILIPTEKDEAQLCYCSTGSDESESIVKASVCCEDRPELVSELRRAVTSVKGQVVKAEIATVGGRTKSVLWMKVPRDEIEEHGLGVIQRAFKVVVDRGFLLTGSVQGSLGRKRRRFSNY